MTVASIHQLDLILPMAAPFSSYSNHKSVQLTKKLACLKNLSLLIKPCQFQCHLLKKSLLQKTTAVQQCFCQSWIERTACIYSRSSCCRCVCTQCAQEQGQTTTRLVREKRPKTKASFCICTCYMYYIIINVSVIEVSAVIKANLGHLANTITNLDENTKFR